MNWAFGYLAHDLHLIRNSIADPLAQQLVVVAHTRIERSVALIRQSAQPHRPQNLIAGLVQVHRVGPRAFQNLRMCRVVVRHVFRPARHIHAQRCGMMLVHDQPPLGSRFDLRVVGKNPRSRHHHVSFQTQNGLKDHIPRGERDPRLLTLLRRNPSGQQVFVVGKEPAVFENGTGICARKIRGQRDRRASGRLLVGPQIHRVHTQHLLRKLVDRVDGSAHVRPDQAYEIRSRRRVSHFDDRKCEGLRARRLGAAGARGYVIALRDQNGRRPHIFETVHDLGRAAKYLGHVALEVLGCPLHRTRFLCAHDNRRC